MRLTNPLQPGDRLAFCFADDEGQATALVGYSRETIWKTGAASNPELLQTYEVSLDAGEDFVKRNLAAIVEGSRL